MKDFDFSTLVSGELNWTIASVFGAVLRRPNTEEIIMFTVIEIDDGWVVFVQEVSSKNPEEVANQPKRMIKHAESIVEALVTAEQYGKEWLAL